MPTSLSRTRWTSAPKSALVARLNNTLGWPEWAGMTSATIITPSAGGLGAPGEIRQFVAGKTTGREEVLEPQGDKVLRYRLLSGLPLKNYVGEVEIVDAGDRRKVTWSASFDLPLPFTGWLVRRALTPFFDQWLGGLIAAEEKSAP